ncbi:hypothetical protein J7E50_12730 [Pedobacter sp. ISL-68]|uniref:hypothetical protein n=1 Tax=unclassified Pedobacter TaxID=2628915 RepID=UPI001BEC1A36|nr:MULTISPECIES: hypothetical protein [unclassified Pedobacter]MBT2561702.1 hypothetical protein [Pedobacter sp. ISL-64]MBT2591090.1 hypothetical protein [Pedobacter sp. ISL-68]
MKKRTMALFTCLLLVSCGLRNKKELPENGEIADKEEVLAKQDTLYQKAEINFYHLGYHDMNSETIDIETISDGKKVSYIYDYQHLKSTNDTLIIYKDSVLFNRIKLFLIKKKKFDSGGRTTEIGKYLYEGFQFAVHLYIDKSKGLVLFRDCFKDGIIEYHLDKEPKDISVQILRDNTFFYKDPYNLGK